MKIFISWSEERSEALAKALREWFPLVLHFVKPWLSKSDIQAGDRWSIEVAKGLETCNFGVLCITRENLNSPWILFEAGALAKSMQDGRVIPLLLDLDFKDISGPLAQFQAKKVDSVGIRELVISLNKAHSAPTPEAQLDKLFELTWTDLDRQIASIPKGGTPTKHNRPQGEILEELVSSVRSVETRIRDIADDEPVSRKRRRARFHPGMVHDLMRRFANGPGDPIQILILASFLRDDAPWIYELAQEAYRATRSGRREERLKAFRRFSDAVELLQRGPFSEEFGIDRQLLKAIRPGLFEMFEACEFEGDDPVLNPVPARIPTPPEAKA